jgi:hypothetical protein
MPYNTPRTWADGELVTAAQLNQDVRDNMGAVNTVATDAQTVANQGHRILTTTQKNALTGVVTGTMVYDSTLGVMQVWNGTIWTSVPEQRIAVKAYQNANQTNTGAASFTNALYDTDPAGAMWSISNPTRITIRTAGLYLLNFYGSTTAASGATVSRVRIRLNNATEIVEKTGTEDPTFAIYQVSQIWQCSVNDYFEGVVNASGTTPVRVGSGNDNGQRTTLVAVRLSA